MKKLMIAAAIVCAAVVAQAAVFDWKVGAGAIYDGSGKTTATTATTVYLFNATDYTQQELLNDLNGGQSYATIQGNAIDKGTLSSGAMKDYQGTAAASKYGSYGENIATYIAVFTDDKVFINKTANTVVKSEPDTTHISANTAYALGAKNTIDSTTFSNAGWYTVNVPEPTSGLLIILGMAGLALKRKRA